MSRVERATRLVAALGMLGAAPAMVVIPTHRAAVQVREAWPALERALAAVDDGLRRGIDCPPGPSGTGRTSVERFDLLCGELTSARHGVLVAAGAARSPWLGDALGPRVPGGAALIELRWASGALAEHLSEVREARLCEDPPGTDRLVAAARGRLSLDAARLTAARGSLEAGRPVLTALAWSLGVIEVVGWALVLWLLPRDVRTLLARRAARRSGQGNP